MSRPAALAAMLLLVAGAAGDNNANTAEHARSEAASAALSAYSREVIAVDKEKCAFRDCTTVALRIFKDVGPSMAMGGGGGVT